LRGKKTVLSGRCSSEEEVLLVSAHDEDSAFTFDVSWMDESADRGTVGELA
jgi:hypothetical protein